jgi:nitrogen fixation/metabolism regulation signal transduction histidine kinase
MKRFNLWNRLELEWKILILAGIWFVAIALPVQNLFVTRLSETLRESIDPDLETTLRTELSEASGEQREKLKEHIERYRQTKVLNPVIVHEQQRLLRALAIGLFILFLIIALWLLQRLTQPLKNLAGTVDRIGKGEIVEVPRESGGALGIVENAVVNLQDELVTLREKARVQGMEAAWKDIARVMAHEIKNPLTPIRLTLDRIEEKTASGIAISTEDLTRFLGRINEQMDMLERLVDQFRSFSREPEVHLSPVSLRPLLQSIADTMSGKVTAEINGDADFTSDHYLLQQVFLNLWKNALEASATEISVTINQTTTLLTLTITDNGSGIPRKELEKIWLPYVTLKRKGTGLGLPVVKRLVETLGGSITLTSTPGNGACVTITFPNDLKKEF